MVLSTPCPRGRGKRRPERREGAAKRPRVESSSSDRRDGSEESRSGGGRDRPGRCSQRAAGPSTPPRRPIPASVNPRRSPRLTKSAVQDLRSLPRTTKGGRRTAHSRSVSGDKRVRGPSRSSLSSSDHGRSSQGRRSRSREPTPPQLRNFDIDDFTVVSHTTDSFTFSSEHHFFPGWVRVVSAHTKDRVRSIPCDHNSEEERRVKQRVRRDVEPPEVRRFLRQELLKKVTPGGIGRESIATTRTTSAFALWQTRTTGPGDRTRGDVHGQNVPLGTSVDTPSKLTLASSWRWLAALKAEWNGQRRRLRDFLPWSHWSSIRSRRNPRGSCPTGSEVPARPSTRIAGWEPSTTAPWGALYSFREDDRQSGADEERGPDVNTFSSCTSFHKDR